MNTRIRSMLAAAMAAAGVSALRAEVIVKENNADAFEQTTSWVGGKVPGPNDLAQWDATVTTGTTYTLKANLSWGGIAVLNPALANLTVSSTNCLTLGAAGIFNSSSYNKTFTWNNSFSLSADQTWSVSGGTHTYAGAVDTAGHVLTLAGSSTKQFKGVISGGGSVSVVGGTFKLTNPGAYAATLAVTATAATVAFDTAAGMGSAPRTGSLTLNGGTLTVGGLSSANTVETNAQALTAGAGTSTVTITPNAAKSAMLYSGSFSRETGRGAVVFRGTGLGTNTLASLTPNSASVVLGAVPALLGAAGEWGSTTNSILPGAYGDTNLVTTTPGMGFVTYEEAYGLRPLDADAEYTAAIVDGQSQPDNVRYANASGSGVITAVLTQDTSVNSLSLVVTGTSTDGGIVVTGETDRVLTLASGCIYASQSLSGTPNANDAQVLAVPVLNLNGREGVIFRRTSSVNNGEEPACLDIRSCITNDGGNGVTFVGPGLTYLAGSSASAYTGPTVCQSGNLRIMKSVSNIGVPGNLVVRGGSVQNTGNQIPDSADIIIEGGGYYQKGGPLNSGSGAWETFRDLFMTGGTYTDGADGTSSGRTYLTNAVLAGGAWTITKGHATEIGRTLTLSGGTLTVKNAQDNTFRTSLSLFGAVTVTNSSSAAYAPLTLLGGASGYAGAKVILAGDLTVVCNEVNTNPVAIAATDPAAGSGAPLLLLDGTRVFNIGEGAAQADAVVSPVLLDNGVTPGGLTKTGAGTLVLAATNGYTGATSVDGGALQVDGSLTSPVTVSSGATLCGTGLVSVTGTALAVSGGGFVNAGVAGAVGTLSVTGDVSFASAAVLQVDVSGASADCLAVSGAVTGNGAVVEKVGEGTGPWRVLTAGSITGTFTSSAPGLSVYKKQAEAAELWLGLRQGTMISVF